MMKTILIFVLALSAALCGHAYDFKIGDLCYRLDDETKTAMVAPRNEEEGPQAAYVSGAVTVPETVEFGGETYTVTGVADKAFSYCARLTSITLPPTIKSVGLMAFMECTSLKEIELPESVEYLHMAVFMNCTALTGLKWPSKATIIPESAFEGCRKLASFTIPPTVMRIEAYAFKECKALTDIEIPTTVRNTGDAILYDCGITHPIYNEHVFYYCPQSMEGVYEIPEGIGVIAPLSFLHCQKLTEVVVPESVKECYKGGFWGCTGLKKPVYNSTRFFAMPVNMLVEEYTVPAGITHVMDGSFEGCFRLKSVILPEGLEYIGYRSFRGCRFLTGIDIPNTVDEIELEAFQGCTRLETVTLPEAITNLYGYTFSQCSALKEIVIPNAVERVGFNVFTDCSSLVKVTIGEGVTEIGASCFSGCTALKDIVALPFHPAECHLSSFDQLDPFIDVDVATCTLWVKPESLEYYQTAPVWERFYNLRALEAGIVNMEAEQPLGITCYDLNGTLVLTGKDASALDTLPSGIYIVNGRKVAVK